MSSNNGKYQLELNVQEPYFSFIKSGKKTVEGRLGKNKYLSLKQGDLIKINDIEAVVVKVVKYSNFKDMLIQEGVENVIPESENLESAVNVYYRFYSKEDEEKFGVVGISIKLNND